MWVLFKGRNKSKAGTIQGNTVAITLLCLFKKLSRSAVATFYIGIENGNLYIRYKST